MDPNHPLLPLALHCLKDKDTERPSADDLCGRLATLKGEPKYAQSLEQSREHDTPLQMLRQQLLQKESELEIMRSNHTTEIQQYSNKIQQQSDELERVRANHAAELTECNAKLQECQRELADKESTIKQILADHHATLEGRYASLTTNAASTANLPSGLSPQQTSASALSCNLSRSKPSTSVSISYNSRKERGSRWQFKPNFEVAPQAQKGDGFVWSVIIIISQKFYMSWPIGEVASHLVKVMHFVLKGGMDHTRSFPDSMKKTAITSLYYPL